LDGKSISSARATVYFTGLGIAVRAGIMPFIDYAQYHLLFPLFLGRDYSDAFIFANAWNSGVQYIGPIVRRFNRFSCREDSWEKTTNWHKGAIRSKFV